MTDLTTLTLMELANGYASRLPDWTDGLVSDSTWGRIDNEITAIRAELERRDAEQTALKERLTEYDRVNEYLTQNIKGFGLWLYGLYPADRTTLWREIERILRDDPDWDGVAPWDDNGMDGGQ